MPRKNAAKHKCEKCGKAFALAMHLGRHMSTIHGQAKQAKAAAPKAGAAGVVAGLRLSSMSLDELVEVITAAKAEAGARLARLQELIVPTATKRPGRPPRSQAVAAPEVAAGAQRRAPRKFKVSGPDSILAFLKKAGAKGATTGQIVQNWKKQGRAGDAYTTLGELVQAGKLKKEKLEGAKGSRYTLA